VNPFGGKLRLLVEPRLGAPVYWNSTTKLATTTASGNTEIGTAVAVAVAGAATLRVRIKSF